MKKKTKPWWVCNKCEASIAEVGKLTRKNMDKHRKGCSLAGFRIEQRENKAK